QLNPETIEILVEGLKSEEKGRNFADLAQERDSKLIAVLKALDDASE
ncbi:MAG: 3-hydroxyacyl-CoA dehydrogenase, partial [Alphaproteobacteria bacterium]|nr:3-hydroxyacyl-CoA dehydrogenase [Alphaproteobacteria bacterium]